MYMYTIRAGSLTGVRLKHLLGFAQNKFNGRGSGICLLEREGGWQGGREGGDGGWGWQGGREGEREGGKEGRRVAGREGGRKGGRKGRMEGWPNEDLGHYNIFMQRPSNVVGSMYYTGCINWKTFPSMWKQTAGMAERSTASKKVTGVAANDAHEAITRTTGCHVWQSFKYTSSDSYRDFTK